jgi:hypothetical protein
MNLTNRSKILQIIAAQPGWKAVYCQESENKQVKISHRVIICWALVEFSGTDDSLQTEVRGIVQESKQLVMVGDLITAEKISEDVGMNKQYLLGYNDPDAHKESDYWIEQAKVRLQSENAKHM